MGFIWTIIIGFIAGVIAKFLMPGPNEPSGFILTTLLGVAGAFVATFLGVKPKDGTGQMKARGSLEPWWAYHWCWRSGGLSPSAAARV